MNIPVHVVLDVCALCTGFAGVWLTAKQHIGCWPAGIVSVCIQGFRFFQSELYADAALQMLFVVMGVYGWIYWKAPNKKIKIKWPLVFSNFMYVCIAAMLFWILLYKVLIFLNGARPILDSGLTVLSLVATGYTILKHKLTWPLWIGVDTLYVVLFAIQNLWFYSVLYLLYTLLAIYGLISWRTQKP